MDHPQSGESLTEASLVMQLQALGHLPTPSSTALRLYALIQSDEAGIPEVAAVIKTDVTLTGRLLRMANLGGYLQRPVISVEESLMRVGTKSVAALAVGLSVIDDAVANAPMEDAAYLGLCRRSVAAAVVAEWFCSQARVPVSASDLFTCALLARIGQLALLRFYPKSYAALMDRHHAPFDLIDQERSQLVVDHQTITLALLREWRFPDVFIDAIRLSEGRDDDRNGEDRRSLMAQLLYYGWEMAPALMAGHRIDLGFHVRRSMAIFGEEIAEEDCQQVMDGLLARWGEWGGGDLISVPSGERMSESEGDEQLSVLLVGLAEDKKVLALSALTAQGYATICKSSLDEAVCLVASGHGGIMVIQEPKGMSLFPARESLLGAWLKDQARSALIILAEPCPSNESYGANLLNMGVDALLGPEFSISCLVAQVDRLADRVQLLKTLERERQAHRRLLSELVLTTRKLHIQTLTDPLTGLSNRRMADAFLKRHWAQLERRKMFLGCLIIDLDCFKQINDQFGHDAGDVALRAFAGLLKRYVRQEDLAARLGGDEFMLICPMTRTQDMVILANRLLAATQELKLDTGILRFSVGMAESDLSVMKTYDDLLKAADQHLMNNKRNR